MYLVYSVTSLLLFLSICLNVLLAGFLKTLSQNEPFASNSLFRPKTLQVAIIKTKSTTIAFFLFSFLPSPRTFFFFSLSFSFVTVIWKLLGLKKPAFWSLFTQLTANFLRLVFKNPLHIFSPVSGVRHPDHSLAGFNLSGVELVQCGRTQSSANGHIFVYSAQCVRVGIQYGVWKWLPYRRDLKFHFSETNALQSTIVWEFF